MADGRHADGAIEKVVEEEELHAKVEQGRADDAVAEDDPAVGDGAYDDDDDVEERPEQKKKPGPLARLVAKLGVDAPTVLIMLKSSLPPIIGIAMYQAPLVSGYFTTLGYLIPIISVLGLAMLPRGKYIQNLMLNLLSATVGAAVAMLALWSSIQARLHTTPPGKASAIYNSSQSAVLAVWLFVNIWAVNSLRARRSSFNLPTIIYSIFVNISTTYGTFMTTTAAAEAFVRELLTAMLVGLALATAVNLLVFPVSSRQVLFKELAGCVGLMRATVAAEKQYLRGLEGQDMFAVATRDAAAEEAARKSGKKEEKPLTKEAKAAKAVRDTTAKMRELAGKIQADLTFAKRDTAWGKLDAKDLKKIADHFRDIYIPITGIATILDIFRRISERRGWEIDEDAPEDVVFEKQREKEVWNEVMKQLHNPFEILATAIDDGLQHAAICLEILPRPKQAKTKKSGKSNGHGVVSDDVDIEARGADLQPGDLGFGKSIDKKVKAFFSKKGELLRSWVKQRGLVTAEEEEEEKGVKEREDEEGRPHVDRMSKAEYRERDQAQLYVIIYLESLMHAAGEAVQDLVDFAEAKVKDGTMSKNRLITPSNQRLRKWFFSVFKPDSETTTEHANELMEAGGGNIVYLGDGYNHKKDPEHFPPENAWERFGDRVRQVSKWFGSEESMFGVRVACATMTIGIAAFLEPSFTFFMEQRLVWAMIMVAMGMTMTSGQSLFGFLCRVGGTFIAMCLAFITWYIVDEKVPGAIVFLWFFIFLTYYFFLKFPRFIPAIMICVITQVLIIGYELQVVTIGTAASTRTGQPYYPTYELAPYRLATVAGGCFVAFIWTIFPSPLSDRTWLRRDLSATLYLLANYFSVINSTMQSQLDHTGGDEKNPGSPAHRLAKIRRTIFGKMMVLLPSLYQHAEWQKWEPTIGGKFPRAVYEEILLRTQHIMGYLTLMSYTITHPPRSISQHDDEESSGDELENSHGEDAIHPARDPASASAGDGDDAGSPKNQRAWVEALGELLASLDPTHHTILSTLALLSNSLLSGQSLPPFLPLPQPYELTRRLMHLGEDKASPTNASHSEGPKYTHMGNRMLGVSTEEQRLADLLDARNMEQPGYAQFAVLQVCSMLVSDDLEALVRAVSSLVGVVDFSFKVEGSKGSLTSSGSDRDERRSKSGLIGDNGDGKGKRD